ncbi:MAG: D-alanyl-D-alanine carboxypeptidase family protein [Clostridiaceae bacterium]
MKKRNLVLIILFVILFNTNVNAKEPYVPARASMAIDCDSKIVLFENNINERIPIASTTKIITIMVALKQGNLDDVYTISKKASSVKGSQVGYKQGEKVTLRELLYGLMLRSGNDAAVAIAEGVGGDYDNFIKMMNEYVDELGMKNTHFESPHGLDSQEHYSTAYELGLITCYAKENEEFNKIVNTKEISQDEYGFTRSYRNINKILFLMPEANGVKTGYTGNAGKCLVVSADFNGKNIVIVLLNCQDRWNQAKKVYQYIDANYENKTIYKKDDVIYTKDIKNANTKLEVVAEKDINVLEHKEKNYQCKLFLDDNKLPISKGDVVGTLCIFSGDNILVSKEVKANNDVDYKSKIKKWYYNNLKKHLNEVF